MVINTTDQQFMNQISSTFSNFLLKFCFYSPHFSHVRIKMVELHVNKASFCCNRFGGSSKLDSSFSGPEIKSGQNERAKITEADRLIITVDKRL